MSNRDMTDVLFSFPNVSAMAARLGIHRTTLQRYKEKPETAPLWVIKALAKANGYQLEIHTINKSYS